VKLQEIGNIQFDIWPHAHQKQGRQIKLQVLRDYIVPGGLKITCPSSMLALDVLLGNHGNLTYTENVQALSHPIYDTLAQDIPLRN